MSESTFVDIKIVGIDDSTSIKPDPNKEIFNIVLELSAIPPFEWSDYFNNKWKQHLYMAKRKAYVVGSSLTIYCVPSELESIHLPELKKVIAVTNKLYKEHRSSEKLEEQLELEEAEAEKAALEDLKKSIKFD